ncbi:MAG: low molecular weight phosphatase family protein [Paracoccaceae bacterium]
MLTVLTLCGGNASRSILAEAIFNRDGDGRVRAWSAGSNPAGQVHPKARSLLERRGVPTDTLRSKSWHEFASPGAPTLDVVLVLCPTVATEAMPDWPGEPVRVTWDIDDPASAPPGQADLAFQHTYHWLSARINALLALPVEDMAGDELRALMLEIGDY